MSDFSTLLADIRSNLMQAGVRYKLATASANGATDGTTIISDDLTELDDSWNNCDTILLTGELRTVEDFTASNDTLDYTSKPFPFQVLSGTIFELSQRGTWRSDDLKRFLIQAAKAFVRIAPNDILVNFAVREIITSTSGVVKIPANNMRFVEPIVLIDGLKVDVLEPEESSYLTEGAFIDSTNGRYIGYFQGRALSANDVGQFKFSPAHNKDCEFHFIPVPSFDSSGNWKVPEEIWGPIVYGTTQIALAANERIELAANWDKRMLRFLPGKKLDE